MNRGDPGKQGSPSSRAKDRWAKGKANPQDPPLSLSYQLEYNAKGSGWVGCETSIATKDEDGES